MYYKSFDETLDKIIFSKDACFKKSDNQLLLFLTVSLNKLSDNSGNIEFQISYHSLNLSRWIKNIFDNILGPSLFL